MIPDDPFQARLAEINARVRALLVDVERVEAARQEAQAADEAAKVSARRLVEEAERAREVADMVRRRLGERGDE